MILKHPHVHAHDLFVGLEYADFDCILNVLSEARASKFDYVVVPLFQEPETFTGAYQLRTKINDLILESKVWQTCVVATVSTWIDCDSPNKDLQRMSLSALRRQILYCQYVGVYATLLPAPQPGRLVNYARLLLSLLKSYAFTTQLCIRVKATANDDGWDTWNTVRSLCNHTTELQVILEVGALEHLNLERWRAEPVKMITLSEEGFQKSALLEGIKEPLLSFFKLGKINVILQDPVGPQVDRTRRARYASIMDLHQTSPRPTAQQVSEMPYQDYLQAPLQPLFDNLEAQTYESFEGDPVKYARYREAITQCIFDIIESKARLTIMVVGAGRGPLVAEALTAIDHVKSRIQHDCQFSIWAIEKNPNAVCSLNARKLKDPRWKDVEIVSTDMRTWQTDEKADIMVSELLGSFGDNELKPECLDGAQRFLAPTGISIPQKYVSYLEPVSCPVAWSDARYSTRKDDQPGHSLETGYVIKFHRHFLPSRPQPCFSFDHPNWTNSSNERHSHFEFESSINCLIHGLAGYFDCTLYKDVTISILPETLSVGMFSWFPMFFPFLHPIYWRKGEPLSLDFWRKDGDSKVWYEWSITSPIVSDIHNINGRSYWVSK